MRISLEDVTTQTIHKKCTKEVVMLLISEGKNLVFLEYDGFYIDMHIQHSE
jgi:hypothetical protein